MVRRTAERILVSEEELSDALSIVEAVLRERNVTADIEVTLDQDPEDVEASMTNCIVIHARQPTNIDALLDAVGVVGTRLRAAELFSPGLPISVDLVPEW